MEYHYSPSICQNLWSILNNLNLCDLVPWWRYCKRRRGGSLQIYCWYNWTEKRVPARQHLHQLEMSRRQWGHVLSENLGAVPPHASKEGPDTWIRSKAYKNLSWIIWIDRRGKNMANRIQRLWDWAAQESILGSLKIDEYSISISTYRSN